jgi:hypothetical protein
MRNFCTYFDYNFLPRGLALIRSLEEYVADFRIFVLCLDDACYEALYGMSLEVVSPVSMAEFEAGDHDLQAAKKDRSRLEYYATCTSSLPLYIFKQWSDVDAVTYLDADLYFFSDPSPLFDEMGSASITITPHRFSPRLSSWKELGTYNVSWLSFRRDDDGFECLKWWRERSLEWCYWRAEDGKFADQGYLEDWPQRFRSVRVIENVGANLAPWNLENSRIVWDGRRVLVDEQPLIFYHFSGLRHAAGPVYYLGLAGVGVRANRVVIEHIYAPYLYTLFEIAAELQSREGRQIDEPLRRPPRQRMTRGVRALVRSPKDIWNIVNGGSVAVLGGRVFWSGGVTKPESRRLLIQA